MGIVFLCLCRSNYTRARNPLTATNLYKNGASAFSFLKTFQLIIVTPGTLLHLLQNPERYSSCVAPRTKKVFGVLAKEHTSNHVQLESKEVTNKVEPTTLMLLVFSWRQNMDDKGLYVPVILFPSLKRTSYRGSHVVCISTVASFSHLFNKHFKELI